MNIFKKVLLSLVFCLALSSCTPFKLSTGEDKIFEIEFKECSGSCLETQV